MCIRDSNGAYQKYGHDEFRAFEAAHLAALKAKNS